MLLKLHLLIFSFLVVFSESLKHDRPNDESKVFLPVRKFPEQQRDLSGWDEIFAEEYRQMMEKENRGPTNSEEADYPFSGHLEAEHSLQADKLGLGEISGLSTDELNRLHILHRGSRIWMSKSFDRDNNFKNKKDGPIKEDVVVILSPKNESVIHKWGKNFFYLPHGIQIDDKGNTWITDVALHQVFKFKPGIFEPSIKLGRAFEPAKSNADDERFCKPTDVAVASNGEFYVSDGYCASRILKYSADGSLLQKFAVDDADIAHSLALAEDLDLICLADREGMRVLCYNAGLIDPSHLGEPVKEFSSDIMGRVFAITYSKNDGVLFGITGQTGVLASQGFTIDLKDDDRYKNDIIAYWSPDDRGFDMPHDITVSSDGQHVYICELKPQVIWKFKKID